MMGFVAEACAAGQDMAFRASGAWDLRRPVPFAIREAVGVFHRGETLQDAIDALRGSGFQRAEVSLPASESAVQAKLGHRYEKADGSVDAPTIPRSPCVTAEVLGQGGLIGGLTYIGAVVTAGTVVNSDGTRTAGRGTVGLAGGTGSLVGSILAKWVGDHHGHYLRRQIEHGGQLLWVRTWNGEDEEHALEILKRHSAVERHMHAVPTET